MKTSSAVLICLAALAGLPGAAAADVIYDFNVTSMSGDTTSVTGSLEFNGKGFGWGDVVRASFMINGEEALAFFVPSSLLGPQWACGGYCYFQFAFSPRGAQAGGPAGEITADTAYTTLSMYSGGRGLTGLWSGEFLSDAPACNNGNNPCYFAGNWVRATMWPSGPAAVPEPVSVSLLLAGLGAATALKRRPKRAISG